MGLKIKLMALALGLIYTFFVLRFVQRKSFRPGYAVLWLSIAFFLISIPIFEGFYKWFTVNLIGIIDARHIIYISLIGFLLIFSFHLTIFISRLSDRVQELISYVAVLENKLDRLESSEENDYKMNKKE
jgi:hypothetical protein